MNNYLYLLFPIYYFVLIFYLKNKQNKKYTNHKNVATQTDL